MSSIGGNGLDRDCVLSEISMRTAWRNLLRFLSFAEPLKIYPGLNHQPPIDP
jgi:hypothetical protein